MDVPNSSLTHFDYIIVGGGTAGCVIANRLTLDPNITVCLIEGGKSDHDKPEVLQLSKWLSLLGGEYDYKVSFIRNSFTTTVLF